MAIFAILLLTAITFLFLCGIIAVIIKILIALFSRANRKRCPYCKELIYRDATVCPHCQSDIAGAKKQAAAEKQTATQEKVYQGNFAFGREWLNAERAARRKEFYGICRKWTVAHSAKIVIVALALTVVAAAIYLLPLLYDLLR